ncbi:MAG: hypothetical protein K0S30_226 [Clostridia bacterium]|jgi:hypothetical protein|nr:hypothetical protein [Clostridia bacterium]
MKRQVTIDGDKSDWYEKAVFILKEREINNIPDNLFLYAENIIENHLKKTPGIIPYKKYEKKTSNAKTIDRFFNISLAVCGITFIIGTVLYFS